MQVSNRIQTPPRQTQQDRELEIAAQAMEANFMEMLISGMRNTVERAEDPSRTEQIFQGMIDQDIADRAAKTKSLGLSRLIVENLKARMQPPQAVPVRDLNESDFVRNENVTSNVRTVVK